MNKVRKIIEQLINENKKVPLNDFIEDSFTVNQKFVNKINAHFGQNIARIDTEEGWEDRNGKTLWIKNVETPFGIRWTGTCYFSPGHVKFTDDTYLVEIVKKGAKFKVSIEDLDSLDSDMSTNTYLV